jgi:hypothetical protein
MRDDRVFRAIGDIDEDLIVRAAPKDEVVRVTFAPWLKWAAPLAACLVIAVSIALPQIMKMNDTTGGVAGIGEYDTGTGGASVGSASENGAIPTPGLTLDEMEESAACYIMPDEWRGLPTENFVLDEQTDGGTAADRIGFRTLEDFVRYTDAWVVVPQIHETAQDGDNTQTAIAEYAQTIGDYIITRQWDDRTVSTGSRVLINQVLIGGCTMDEPNNLLRVGGVYLLPLKFNPYVGAFNVVGDLDVLFELNDEGKIVSHSKWEGLSQYDGKSFSALIDDVEALYPPPEAEFAEQPINSLVEAENQVNVAYLNFGFRKFSVEFDSLTVIRGADAYLFKVTFGENGVNGSEYAAIAALYGAFLRGELGDDGDINVVGGLGSFPKNSRQKTED